MFKQYSQRDEIVISIKKERVGLWAKIGLVLAGLISAILSSVDSALNSSSTLIVIDFIKPGKPDLTPQYYRAQ